MDHAAMTPEQDPRPEPWYVRHRLRSLLLLFLGVVLIGATAAVTVYSVYVNRLKQSVPYQLALAQVAADPGVQQSLGRPIESTRWAQGLVDEAKNYGEFVFRIAGPTGKGTVRGVAERDSATDPWRLVFLDVATYSDFGVNVLTLIDEKPPAGNLPEPTEAAKEAYGVGETPANETR